MVYVDSPGGQSASECQRRLENESPTATPRCRAVRSLKPAGTTPSPGSVGAPLPAYGSPSLTQHACACVAFRGPRRRHTVSYDVGHSVKCIRGWESREPISPARSGRVMNWRHARPRPRVRRPVSRWHLHTCHMGAPFAARGSWQSSCWHAVRLRRGDAGVAAGVLGFSRKRETVSSWATFGSRGYSVRPAAGSGVARAGGRRAGPRNPPSGGGDGRRC